MRFRPPSSYSFAERMLPQGIQSPTGCTAWHIRRRLKVRATIGKRKGRETQVTDMLEPAAPPQLLWDDVQGILDEELSRLSDKHRTVIVMCDLEGKTRTEVAQRLGLPEGTIASRLARVPLQTCETTDASRNDVVRLCSGGCSGPAVAGVLAQQAASAALPCEAVAATITSGVSWREDR